MLSAIIPNYNHGAKIGLAVAALQEQSLPPDEIIIIDDGSTDDSVATIKHLAAQDHRIRVICHDRNMGAIAALNTGLRAAHGPFVYLAAADDITKPNLMQTLCSVLEFHPRAAFASGEVALHRAGEIQPGIRPPVRPSNSARYFDPAETKSLFRRIDNFILTGAALMRLSAVKEAGYLQAELGAFADGFLVRQLAFRHGFVYVPSVLAEWHISDEGLSRSSALSAATATAQMTAASGFFKFETAIPAWYWPLFRRRWIFAILRISLIAERQGLPVIEQYAPGPKFLRPLFVILARLGKNTRPICLVWATLWYRPTSLRGLIKTYIGRRCGRKALTLDDA